MGEHNGHRATLTRTRGGWLVGTAPAEHLIPARKGLVYLHCLVSRPGVLLDVVALADPGGNDRYAERSRVNVTLAIRSAVRAIERVDPLLGGHLRSAVRTGRYCCYLPDPASDVQWEL